jgi:cobalamin biosynthesis protein CobD/CbiB
MDKKRQKKRRTKIEIGVMTILLILFWSYIVSVFWTAVSYLPLPMFIIFVVIFILVYPAIISTMLCLYASETLSQSMRRLIE